MKVNDMIQAHWEYVMELLVSHGVPDKTIKLIGYHYRTAMKHGYKHGLEDRDDE